MNVEDYILMHGDAEPDYLSAINRKTHQKILNPRMLSGHLQGRVLAMFSKMIRPDVILEIGTFTGYSALCLAEGLSEKGKLHTIECDDELEDFIRKNFKESPYNEQIELHIGDAKNIIYDLHDTFDLIFIDADKREYQTYYDAVFPKLRPGGFMLIDNTLWNDKVLDEDGRRDKQTAAILAFNENIARDTRIEKLILPLRDGLTLIRKK
ncbi:MAG: O-methyltransferase [Paludibacter sp.]|jgi:predicted O-methyltransferase YrrM|nr:O-methyltransferase [Bacteroidales bacterium]